MDAYHDGPTNSFDSVDPRVNPISPLEFFVFVSRIRGREGNSKLSPDLRHRFLFWVSALPVIFALPVASVIPVPPRNTLIAPLVSTPKRGTLA
jgi:hypothetical protein